MHEPSTQGTTEG